MPIPLKSEKNKNQPSFIKMEAKTSTHAVMELYGTVGGDWFDEGITSKDVVKKISELPASIKTLDLHINSPGGSVFEGLAIMNRIKEYGKNKKVKVTAYIDALSASIASVIMLGAEEIVMGEAAFIMIHKPMSGVYGNADEMEKVISILDDIENQMISLYMKRTGLSRIEIKEMMAKETWMDADQAIEYGFADRKQEEEYAIAACLNPTMPWMAKAPSKLSTADKIAKAKADALKNKIDKFLLARK